MQNNNILFITFDLSGYYTNIHEALKSYGNVDYFNMADISFDYKNKKQKIYGSAYKLLGKQKLNYYALHIPIR